MPFTAKQRRAAFAELSNRSAGKGNRMFSGMSKSDLETYAHSSLEKKKRKISAGDQAKALRKGA